MAKFCIKCGSPLDEGKPCSCQVPITNTGSETVVEPVVEQAQAQDYSQYQEQFEKAKKNSTIFLKSLFETFKGILLLPSTEGAKFLASKSMDMAIGLLAFQSILSALFALAVTAKIDSLIMQGYSLFSGMAAGIEGMVKMPLFKTFLTTFILSAILSCALAGILLLISHLFKNTTNYKSMLCLAASRSAAVIPITILAIILFYLNPVLGISIFYIGNLVGLSYMVSLYPAATSEVKNRVPGIVALSSIIFLFISVYIMSKSFSSFLPVGLKAAWSFVEGMLANPSMIFEQILSSLL